MKVILTPSRDRFYQLIWTFLLEEGGKIKKSGGRRKKGLKTLFSIIVDGDSKFL